MDTRDFKEVGCEHFKLRQYKCSKGTRVDGFIIEFSKSFGSLPASNLHKFVDAEELIFASWGRGSASAVRLININARLW